MERWRRILSELESNSVLALPVTGRHPEAALTLALVSRLWRTLYRGADRVKYIKCSDGTVLYFMVVHLDVVEGLDDYSMVLYHDSALRAGLYVVPRSVAESLGDGGVGGEESGE